MKQFLPILMAVSFGNAAQAPSPAPPDSLPQQQVAALVARADSLTASADEARHALDLYSEALSLDRKSPEILWRISQSYVEIADQLSPEEQDRRLSLYEKALEFAEGSVRADERNSRALARRGIARTRLAPFKGFWESISLLKDARDDLERALELDSTNHAAHAALALTHLKVIERPWILRWPLGLGWGDREEAVRHLERAIELRWDHIDYRLAAARLYIEEEEYAKARAHLSLIPLLRPVDHGDLLARQEARSLLQHLGDTP